MLINFDWMSGFERFDHIFVQFFLDQFLVSDAHQQDSFEKLGPCFTQQVSAFLIKHKITLKIFCQNELFHLWKKGVSSVE
jgi:hypothetical protein